MARIIERVQRRRQHEVRVQRQGAPDLNRDRMCEHSHARHENFRKATLHVKCPEMET